MRVSVPLSAQQEAHVALILEVHAAAQADLDRRAQQAINVRSQRLAPVLTELGIPSGADISVIARHDSLPAYLAYEGTMTPSPVADSIGQASEKSTSADAPEP